MFWKKNKNVSTKNTNTTKYKAVYKSLYSEKTDELILNRRSTPLVFSVENNGIYDVFILTHIIEMR